MDLSNISDSDLLKLKKKLNNEVSKYHNFQLAKKVQLNSAYGAMGNQFFRFYDIRLAEAVTKSGRVVIQYLAKDINDYLNGLLKTNDRDYIIAIDTDSVYINLADLVTKVVKDKNLNDEQIVEFLDKVCKEKIEKVINESCENLAKYLNAYKNKMVMKREAIASKAIWTRKKRYAMYIHDLEGVRFSHPKIKIMGIEVVRSSTPEVCRAVLKKTIELIFESNNGAVVDFIENFRDEFNKLPAEEIACPTSIKTMNSYSSAQELFRKGTPYHVKGAFVYNTYLRKLNLDNRYPLIREGDHIKTLCLLEPNDLHSPVISFVDVLPRQFNLEPCIDYDAQFEKAYLKPISAILDAIGWQKEHVATLDCLWE